MSKIRLFFTIIEQTILLPLILAEPFVFPFFGLTESGGGTEGVPLIKSLVTVGFMLLLFGFWMQNWYTIYEYVISVKNKKNEWEQD